MRANSIDTKTASERSRAEGESESTYAQPADFCGDAMGAHRRALLFVPFLRTRIF